MCCRGFWEAHKDAFPAGQIAQRLGLVEFVDVDTLKTTEGQESAPSAPPAAAREHPARPGAADRTAVLSSSCPARERPTDFSSCTRNLLAASNEAIMCLD